MTGGITNHNTAADLLNCEVCVLARGRVAAKWIGPGHAKTMTNGGMDFNQGAANC